MTKTRDYYLIFVALLVLTAATVSLSFVDLGRFHAAAGLGIAAIKTALIALFFMHVLRGPRLIWAVGLGGLVWLVILMSMTLSDFQTRSWNPQKDPGRWQSR